MSLLLALTGSEPPIVVADPHGFVIRKTYVRRGHKIHLFNTEDEAEAFERAEELANQVIEKAKSKSAKRRAKRKVYAALPPSVEIDAGWADAMARTFTTQENPPDYTTILKLLAQRMEEEEEEIFLLLIS